MKRSCGNETCEEVIVPGGNFAFGAEAWLTVSPSDQIVGDVLEGGEVGGGVVCTENLSSDVVVVKSAKDGV